MTGHEIPLLPHHIDVRLPQPQAIWFWIPNLSNYQKRWYGIHISSQGPDEWSCRSPTTVDPPHHHSKNVKSRTDEEPFEAENEDCKEKKEDHHPPLNVEKGEWSNKRSSEKSWRDEDRHQWSSFGSTSVFYALRDILEPTKQKCNACWRLCFKQLRRGWRYRPSAVLCSEEEFNCAEGEILASVGTGIDLRWASKVKESVWWDKTRPISLSGSEARVGACCLGEMFGGADSAGGVRSIERWSEIM